jgi:transposase-like protein
MKQIKCVHCGKSNYKKKGFRQTQNRGKIQRFICNECGKQFTNDDGFYRMRNSEKKITAGIDLYFSNLSSRKVRNHFRRHWEHNSSHVTVLDWCRKYTLKVQKYVDKQTPQLGGQVYADETDIPRGCNTKRKGGDKFWCSVDWETRYINATLYSPNPQNMRDGIEFMKRIKEKSIPKYIQTDALGLYPTAFKKVFGQGKRKHNMNTKHIVNNHHKTGKHNVRIETVFMKIKDRVDDFRGLKALWSAPILLAGIVLQHNFIEAHTTTNKVPCELAKLKLDTGINRWLGLIKLASE